MDELTYKALEGCLPKRIPFVLYRLPGHERVEFYSAPSLLTGEQPEPRVDGFFISTFNTPFAECHWIPRELDAEATCRELPSMPLNLRLEPEVCTENTDEAQYLAKVDALIRQMRELEATDPQAYYKAVISTTHCARLAEPVAQMVGNLLATSPREFVNCYYHPATGFWIGATPELLLSYDGDTDTFATMALAGTLPKDDAWDDKNRSEQACVRRFIMQSLAGLGLEVTESESRDVSFGALKHLCNTYTGHLRGIDPSLVLDTLNPTPALCGLPREWALQAISKVESHQRKCYGGYIGIRQGDSLQAYVNIRCANFRGEDFCFYSGGGVIASSDAKTEWLEAENKFLNFEKKLVAAPTAPEQNIVTEEMSDTPKKGYPLLIILLAVAIVFVLSFVKWGDLTGNFMKDYGLFSDLNPNDSVENVASNEIIDPEFEHEMEGYAAATQADGDSAVVVVDLPPRIAGEMVIEDYTPGKTGLNRLRAAITDPRRPARIAVIGDSYIEGDIFTQDIRDQLQSQYGGKGVGYVPAHSLVAGFRRTVSISDKGWEQVDIKKTAKDKYFPLAGEYYKATGPSHVVYKGYSKDPKLEAWDNSRILFVAPRDGVIKLTTDNDTVTYEITANDAVQSINLPSHTTTLRVDNNITGLVYLGAWLEGADGVTVDCMSVRGDSGITHRYMGKALADQMSQFVDYDLIIMEYGINALSAKQKDYTHYGELMTQVANTIKENYPNAQVLMLAIGDRGQKANGAVHSLPTASAMVAAQRKAAQDAGILFWDTREAMGGEDAVVDWRERKLVNGDYIHLNAQGGKELATQLVQSINKMLGE